MENGESSWLRFLDGDDSGFEEIVRDYKDGLIFYLNGFVKDLTAAEELAEDTFVKLGIKKPRFSGRSSFKTWLYTVGRNLALDWLRQRGRHAARTVPLDDPETGEEPSEEDSPETAYLREERKKRLHRAMQKLKPEYRQVLWLTYFEDFSARQTAQIMKKSVHNIETLTCRARQALKAELIREGFDHEDL